ncbi:MAG: NOB1 family endonuclease [Halodesulfurarchaeum sp.]
MYVLDASAFIEEFETEEPVATIPAVREELRDGAGYRYDAMEGAGMHVHIPDADILDRVRRVANSTGDLDVLSGTDLRLLAAASELDGTLVTDDYAMQNVADALELTTKGIAQDGITERRDWHFQCQGCGREFEEYHDRCPICGSDLARKNPS